MRILTLDNTSYSMDSIPDEIDEVRFCVLDNSDPKDPDYFYIPLIFLESFNSPALVLRIGDRRARLWRPGSGTSYINQRSWIQCVYIQSPDQL